MTSEISSLTQSLLSSARELAATAVGRVSRGTAVQDAQPTREASAKEAQAAEQARAREDRTVDDNDLNGTVSDLNVLAQQLRRELQFSVEQDSGELVVKVIDKETDEVVRQIPPKEVLELRKRLLDAAGVIFRDSV